jgi:hypothetical protein
MNIEDFDVLPDKDSLIDELLSQLFPARGSAFGGVQRGLPYLCRFASRLSTFPHQAAEIRQRVRATEDAA